MYHLHLYMGHSCLVLWLTEDLRPPRFAHNLAFGSKATNSISTSVPPAGSSFTPMHVRAGFGSGINSFHTCQSACLSADTDRQGRTSLTAPKSWDRLDR